MGAVTIRILLLAVAVLASGCLYHNRVALDASGAVPVALADEPLPVFRIPERLPEVSNHIAGERIRSGHERRRLSFTAHGPNGQPDNLYLADWYRSTAPGPKPLVIVLPIWGASDYPPDVITRGLLRRHGSDLHVMRVVDKSRIMDWDAMLAARDASEFAEIIARMADRVETQVIDTRRLIRWAAAREEIDADRIGITGFSISAIAGAMVVVSEPKVARSVLAMGGANMGEISANCGGLRAELREQIKPRLGWTRDQYLEFFRHAFAHLDPARYPGRVDPRQVLLIDALHDDCVPPSARDALWETLGRPERVTYRYSHRNAFYAMTPLGFNHMRREIYRFFDPLIEQP